MVEVIVKRRARLYIRLWQPCAFVRTNLPEDGQYLTEKDKAWIKETAAELTELWRRRGKWHERETETEPKTNE